MAETIRKKPYWRQTKFLALSTLISPFIVIAGLAMAIGRTGVVTLGGIPLTFLLAAHGVIILVIVAAARFVLAQDRIDRWHGAKDEA